MQASLGREAGTHACYSMGALVLQAEGVQEAVVDGLDDLAVRGMGAAQGLRPARGAPVLGLRRADDLSPVQIGPSVPARVTLEAGVGDVDAVGRRANLGHGGVSRVAQGEEARGQVLVGHVRRGQPAAGEGAQRRDRHEQVQAVVPAQAGAPALGRLPVQPAVSAPLAVAGDHAGRVERLIGAGRGVKQVGEALTDGDDGAMTRPHGPIILAARGQAARRCATAWR